MNRVFIYKGVALNVDNAEDAEIILENGGVELDSEKIKALGMLGYEHLVSQANTKISPDNKITFTPPTEEELVAQAVAAAKAWSNNILMARMRADMVQTGAFAAAEFATFAKSGLFTDWAAGQTYAKGYRLAHNGIVYEVMQEVMAIESQPPDAAGMLAVYRPLSVDPETGDEPDGSIEHPYAFIYGMDVSKDSYYTYEDKRWLAKSDMPACVWVPGTEGLWQWEEVKNEAVYTPKV